MTRTEKRAAIIAHYESLGYEIITAKGGGYWIRKDGQTSHVADGKAAKSAGIQPTPRQTKIALPWGDYATVAMLNRPRQK
jgi:hypothetical protein